MSKDTTSSTSLKHGHIHIRPTTLDKGLSDVFHENYHPTIWLAQTAIQYSELRGTHLTRLQKLAIHRYHHDPIFDITSPPSGVNDLAVMTAYSQLFNELFFFGSLKDRIHLKFKENIESLDKELWGEVVPHGNRKGGLKRIWMTVKDPHHDIKSYDLFIYSVAQEFDNRTDRLLQYISGLLHEMIHIYFNIWTCKKDRCSGGLDRLGRTGHGFLWLDVATALMIAVKDEKFLNLSLSLNRSHSLAREMVVSRVRMPRENLTRWGLEENVVSEHVEILEEYGLGIR